MTSWTNASLRLRWTLLVLDTTHQGGKGTMSGFNYIGKNARHPVPVLIYMHVPAQNIIQSQPAKTVPFF